MRPAHPVPALPPSGSDALVGQLLAGRYRIAAPIAQGGMATVFRATQQQEPREVAVKVMHPLLARERAFGQRFKREARLAGRLAHPGIVRTLDHGVEGATFFLVMEMLDGEDLSDLLRRRGTLDEATARRIVVEICEALAVAHALGIVHRDLKPENVYLARGPDGDVGVKVLDFGIAKMLQPEERGSADDIPLVTAMGALLGTPEYMSPEQAKGLSAGPAGDLYACGVLLYAMLTGRAPFVAQNPVDVILKHVNEAPPLPSSLREGLDPALEALVLRALAKDPDARPASAAALADALRALGPTAALTPGDLGMGIASRRHIAEAPTLAQGAAEPEPPAEPSARADALTGPPPARPASAPAPDPAPPTERVPVRRDGTPSVSRAVLLFAVILAALVGFALGRWTAP